jgi:hypothetical protein
VGPHEAHTCGIYGCTDTVDAPGINWNQARPSNCGNTAQASTGSVAASLQGALTLSRSSLLQHLDSSKGRINEDTGSFATPTVERGLHIPAPLSMCFDLSESITGF